MSDGSMDFSRLDQTRIAAREGGKAIMAFGLALRLVFRGGETRRVREAVLEVAEGYAGWAGDRVTRYVRHNASSRSRLGPGGVRAAYGSECANLDPAIDEWGPMILGPDEVSSIGFNAMVRCAEVAVRRPNSALTARFPAVSARTEPDRLIALVLDWCSRVRPIHGVVGLSPLFELGMERSYPWVLWPFLDRFVGLDYDWASWALAIDSRRIRGVNWLTILDDGLVEELGGRLALEAELGDAAKVMTWNGGVLIRAGAEPQMGDRDVGQWPSAYLAVNRVLKPIRFEEYPAKPLALIKVPPPLDPREETLKWVRRFDRDGE